MKILTLGIFLFSLSVANAQPTTDQIKHLNPANPDCELIGEKINGLKTGDLDKAVQLLGEIKSPSKEDIAIATSALKADPDESIYSYMKLASSACTMARYKLAKLIMDSINNSINDKKPTAAKRKHALDSLKATVSTPHYPVLIAASINAAIIDFGIEKGAWTLSETKLKTLKEIRAGLQSYTQAMQPKFNELGALLKEHERDPDRLKENKRFQKLRELPVEEASKSREYLDQLTNLAKSLSYRS